MSHLPLLRKSRWALLLMVAMALLTACLPDGPEPGVSANVVEQLSGETESGFARAYDPMEFQFPEDHGPHPAFQTEWWYFTGNLTDDAGHPYGYQFTVFRRAATPTMVERSSDLASNQIYMAHFAVTDGDDERHHSFERFSRGAGGLAGAVGDPLFQVWLDDWSVEQIEPGRLWLRASAESDDGPVGVDLILLETRPPILHGDAGLSQKSAEPGNANYYYSLVGLESSGTITTPRTTGSVSGVSWMDHEFGTSALSEDAVGWDWFSVQLDDGTALMFAQIRTRDGAVVDEFEGTLVDADGTQLALRSSDFSLETGGQWRSPRSGATYPSGWQVAIPEHSIELSIDPLIDDQEMDVGYVYWEGAVDVSGSRAGQPIGGRGYVELTGYGAETTSDYQR